MSRPDNACLILIYFRPVRINASISIETKAPLEYVSKIPLKINPTETAVVTFAH